jgi:glycerol-3-phosphate acyltransferase PlsY
MFRLVCLLIGYLFGCVQTAYFTGKLFRKIDIREHGSGNAGATNAIRVFGVKLGVPVFIIDVLKAIGACVVCAYIFSGQTSLDQFPIDPNFLPVLYAGLGTVLGHSFPVFLKFRGGKGVACTVGVLLMLNFSVAFICYFLAAMVISFTKYVSLGSLLLLTAFPAVMAMTEFKPEEIAIAVVICVIGWIMHKENISDLLQKRERKLGQK